MGLYIGEKEENYAFRAGHWLQHFLDMEALAHCKRLSVRHNNLTSLPTKGFRCPELVSLLIGFNEDLVEIPEGFFLNFPSVKVLDLRRTGLKSLPTSFFFNLPSLKVLDLRRTALKSLPTSFWQLIHLEFLDLSWTLIENILSKIGNLVHLQFLYLIQCTSLMSLPSEIGKLTNLKYLDVRCCENLIPFPHDIEVPLNCTIVEI
jgi:Leucine-rich repeat (LRR) protein